MIFKIIVNIILAINIFLYGMNNEIYFSKISYPIVVALICVSLSLYTLYIIRLKKDKLLILNIFYMIVVSYLYPPSLVILIALIVEYVQVKKYSEVFIFGAIAVYIFSSLKMELDYTNIFLGIMSFIFIYEFMHFTDRNKKLEKYNYDLKEKIYSLEERRKIDSKISYQNVETVKIEERNIISQKLHDKIGHTLAGSIMQLEALKIIKSSNNEKENQMLDGIINNLRNGMDDIRATLRKIKPEQGQISINNLKLTLEEFSNKSNIETKLSVEGDLNEINIVYWRAIIECVSEVLTNSIKYCNGDLINVEISVLNKIIRLHIKDNGSYKGKIKKGMGLLGIEERIVNLGGDVYFSNEDGFSNLIIFKR